MKPIKAIATEYKGIHFRSRTEAKWAAFFDIAGWRWDYEPLDLEGYIPDFLVRFARPVLVEVKPFLWDGSDDEEQEIGHTRVKIDRSGWNGEAWILGSVVLDEYTRNARYEGVADWFCGLYREDASWGACGLYACGECGNKTPFHRDMSWRCRCCGADEHARRRMQPWNVAADLRAAANAVQWRAA